MMRDAFESLRRRSLRAARGFTLIEIMLATAIPGMGLRVRSGPAAIVGYITVPNPDRRGWFLLKRIQYGSLLSNPPTVQNAGAVVLANNLVSLHIRYFDGDSWSESW